MKLRPFLTILALTLALSGLTLRAAAGAEKPAVDPSGTWKVTVSSTNTQAPPAPQTLTLKLSGGTLTGTLSKVTTVGGKSRVNILPITEAKIQGSEISFNYTHPPAAGDGPNPTYSYQGRISGSTIKGTFTMEWMGQSRTRDWQAERARE